VIEVSLRPAERDAALERRAGLSGLQVLLRGAAVIGDDVDDPHGRVRAVDRGGRAVEHLDVIDAGEREGREDLRILVKEAVQQDAVHHDEVRIRAGAGPVAAPVALHVDVPIRTHHVHTG